jgi:hypothetical protein
VSLDYREYDRIVQDGRVHCCFYFIAPHRIKPLDIEFMNRLQKQVIIVPILAKSDTMTIQERREHLINVRDYLAREDITIFDFEEEDIEEGWAERLSAAESGADGAADTAPLALSVGAEEGKEQTKEEGKEEVKEKGEEVEGTGEATSGGQSVDASGASADVASREGAVPANDAMSDTAPAEDVKAAAAAAAAAAATDTGRSNTTASTTAGATTTAATTTAAVRERPSLTRQASAPLPQLRNLFAVIADDKHDVRSYPWGEAGVYNKEHSDLPRLQELLFEQHRMQRLSEATHEIYRRCMQKQDENKEMLLHRRKMRVRQVLVYCSSLRTEYYVLILWRTKRKTPA